MPSIREGATQNFPSYVAAVQNLADWCPMSEWVKHKFYLLFGWSIGWYLKKNSDLCRRRSGTKHSHFGWNLKRVMPYALFSRVVGPSSEILQDWCWPLCQSRSGTKLCLLCRKLMKTDIVMSGTKVWWVFRIKSLETTISSYISLTVLCHKCNTKLKTSETSPKACGVLI